MKILWLRYNLPVYPSVSDHAALLIRELRMRKHQVNVCGPSDSCADPPEFSGGMEAPGREEGARKSWDVVVIEGMSAMPANNQYLAQAPDAPLVCVCSGDGARDRVPLHPLLCHVIVLTERHNLPLWGIPEAICTQILPPEEASSSTYCPSQAPPFRILYVHDPADSALDALRQAIAGLNMRLHDRVKIFAPGLESLVRSFANSQVSPSEHEDSLQQEIEASDLVLASGSAARRALVAGRPCITVGCRGLGGLIIPENYRKQRTNNFEGRLAGELREPVPAAILNLEIDSTLRTPTPDLLKLVETNESLASDDFSVTLASSRVEEALAKTCQMHMSINHPDLLRQMKPFLAPNVVFRCISGGSSHDVVRKPLADVPARIGPAVRTILNDLNGSVTIGETLAAHNVAPSQEEQLLEGIRRLWQKKIILFPL